MTDQEEQRLERTMEKMARLKAQREAMDARDNKKERKARTRRLIQNGALVEKYFNAKDIPPSELDTLLREIVSVEEVREILGRKQNADNSINISLDYPR
jgi:hypothetical protein